MWCFNEQNLNYDWKKRGFRVATIRDYCKNVGRVATFRFLSAYASEIKERSYMYAN